MPLLLHISDTHCKCPLPSGCKDSSQFAWVETLAAQLKTRHLTPKLLVHSGDLTGKSRIAEYQCAFEQVKKLKQIAPNILTIPGNQDVFRDGLDYYHHFFGSPYSTMQTERFFVVGVNSAESEKQAKEKNRMGTIRHYDHLAKIHRGFVGPEHYDWIYKQFKKAQPHQLKVFVLHHHLIHIPGTGINESMLMDDADVLQLLLDLGVDIVLAGHRHRSWFWEIGDGHHKKIRILHAGRLSNPSAKRQEDQGYNGIFYEDDHVVVRRYFLNKPDQKPEEVARWKVNN